MLDIEATDFVLQGVPNDGGLDIVVTRYRHRHRHLSTAGNHGSRLSLVCLHAISYYKESWLPTIEYLFELESKSPNSDLTIIEVWSIDGPNHGRSAIINEDRLMERPQGVTAHEMARAAQVLLKSGLIQGTSVVGFGHSASGCSLPLATIGYPIDELPFSSIVLVEPGIMTPQMIERATAAGIPYNGIIDMVKRRKDTWPSRTAARSWMSTRLPWKHWTPRSLDLFVEHGLRDLPTSTYPDVESGVTLCCTRAQESVSYVRNQDSVDCLERLKEICPVIPVHCVFGDRPDLIPDFVKADIVDEKQGRKMASITTIPGRGHLIVMEDPQGVASAVWDILCSSRQREKLSKL